ncbi:MAG: DUF4270 domain-containing protein [Muribaculaceae bacterium]
MKFRSLHILPVVAAMTIAVIACDDETSPIGGSLTGDSVEIIIDSSFTVSGTTHRVSAISPRTTEQLIGSITIPGYGTLSSEVVTQFLPSTLLDTANFSANNLDSMALTLSYLPTDFIGDSVAPLGITAYPLTQLLPKDISSDFDPAGYYNPTPLGSAIYNASTIDDPTTAKQGYRTVDIKLPVELGKRIFNDFIENPENFANGQVFSKNVFPGVYLKNSFGSGRLTVVKSTGLGFYFTKITEGEGDEKNDTTTAQHQYMLVTPEVISNNDLTYRMDAGLEAKLAAGEDILVAPAGTETEFVFPIKDIIASYKKQSGSQAVVNGLTMSIPVDSLVSGVTPPPYVLMVLKKDRDEFFAQNKLPNNITSFYAQYSSATGRYVFSSLRAYMMEMLTRDEIKEEDYTFDLIPVQVNFEQLVNNSYYGQTQYIESEVQPYLTSPAVGQLHLDKAKIQLTFSRLSANQ